MKLKCTECDLTIECSDHVESALEHAKCLDPECVGRMRFYKGYPPMIGDPEVVNLHSGNFRISGFNRQTLLYKHVMDQKRGIVPESRRRGLWYHL